MEPLRAFVDAFVGATNASEEDARRQLFDPTCYPAEVVVSPGVVFHKPTGVEYAPDIVLAERKIRAITAAARAGKISVINITIEPGSGKTLFLPYKFAEGRSLVVLPTVFDAWSAHTSATGKSDIHIFGFRSNNGCSVVYTDSYHASYLITTGNVSEYSRVFVDESHSQEGVTPFLQEVALPGISFIRMTASPPTLNSSVKKSFPVMEESGVPNVYNTNAAVKFISSRTEPRVLALAPSSAVAEALVKGMEGALLLTPAAPLEDIFAIMNDQDSPAVIVADATCGKGANLNLDCNIDFGIITTPAGDRTLTRPEQLQRKHRVGRNKSGTYCCSHIGTADRVKDDYSTYRSNIWRALNGLMQVRTDFAELTTQEAERRLFFSLGQPALMPVQREVPVNPVPVTPVLDDSDSAHSVDHAVNFGGDAVFTCTVEVDDQDESSSVFEEDLEAEFLTPSWVSYYVLGKNHPSSYVADAVFHHRKLASPVQVQRGFVVERAVNRITLPTDDQASGTHEDMSFDVPSTFRRLRVTYDNVREKAGLERTRTPSPYRQGADTTTGSGKKGTDNSLKRWSGEKHTHHPVRYGTQSYEVAAFRPLGADAAAGSAVARNPQAVTRLGRRLTTSWSADVGGDTLHLGGPLAILRSSKHSRRSRATAYSGTSICGGYLVTTGVVFASGDDLHPKLTVLDGRARRDLELNTTQSISHRATHFLTWTSARPLDTVDVEIEVSAAKARGAWHVPPINEVPVIDLSMTFHSGWSDVMSDRIRSRVTIPQFVPRCGYTEKRRGQRARTKSDDVVNDAFEALAEPTYSQSEVRLVSKAWNVVALRSAAISGVPDSVYNDATELLTYLTAAHVGDFV